MAPYTNFLQLPTSQRNEVAELPEEEYLRFGNHIYAFRKEINITQLLDELASCGTEGNTSPVLHLHVYCHRLVGALTNDEELILRVNNRGCTLRSLHIFTVQLPWLKRLTLVGNGSPDSKPVRLSLYYDVASSPENFWINYSGSSSASVHVLRGESACIDREALACSGVQHFDASIQGSAGIKVDGSGPLEAIPSIYWEELRPHRVVELKAFGTHCSRLQNLPRLLTHLFTSAAEELVGPQPDITSISAKLRFINLCARDAPNLVGFVSESQTLLNHLELPKLPGAEPFKDCFFVPDKVPKVLESGMEAHVDNLIDLSRKLDQDEEMKRLRDLIRKQGGELLDSIKISVGSTIPKADLDAKAVEAANKTETVIDKMDDLRKYNGDLDEAKIRFDKGIKDFQEAQEKKMIWDIVKSIVEIGVSVGIAIYTGGAGAPLTVGAVNKLLQGTAETIKESSRLVVALKALGKVLLTVYPKLNAALQNHSKFSEVGGDNDNRGTKLVDSLKSAAGAITDKILAGKAGERVDYLGLLADWREMDVGTDSAFAAIKDEIKDAPGRSEFLETIDEYCLAMKKLAIRGETLVMALKESYEARTQYLVLVAETRAKEVAVEEIKSLHQTALGDQSQETIAFMYIRQRLLADVAQRQRVVFNLLHEGVLALTYQSNDVKLQKSRFNSLSAALTADQLKEQWEKFKKASIEIKQPQSKTLTVDASEALPPGWRDLLTRDLETPFQILPTLKKLQYHHHMRIREIYAEFVDLKRKDGTTDGIDKLEYTIWMGPLMVDRASPYKDALSKNATIVQYYMEPQPLVKTGKDNHLIDDKGDFAKRALCCSGRLTFRKEVIEEGWDLETITNVKLNIVYETLVFSK